MKPMAERHALSGERSERLSSFGSFIWADPARVLAAAGRHTGDGQASVIECRLRGASMAPAIPPRSRIRIACTGKPYRNGEVVAFMSDAQVVVHRIVYRRRLRGTDELLITRGDAMIIPDRPIEAGAVLGRVVAMATGTDWQPVGAQMLLPRRERLLASALLVVCVETLHVSVPLAQRLACWLQATDRRLSWTRKFLY
jgi:hypothetical protein